MATRLPRRIRLFSAALLLMTGTVSTSAAAERLTVRLYINAGVAPLEMARARSAAAAILSSATLRTTWRDCGAGCADALGPRDVVVRIVAAPDGAEAGVLGSSLVDVQAKQGTLATIYVDRVDAMALRAGVDAGTVLGRAIAHEIGHLLLGTSAHAAAGLMRARWSEGELRRDLPSDWRLSADDVTRIRRGVAGRQTPERLAMSRSDTPQTVASDEN